MKLWKGAILAITMGLAAEAAAQSVVAVDINRAKLRWQWVQGAPPADGTPDEFRVKCGQASGNYTRTTVVAYPTLEVAVKTAITGSGNWFCVVTAANQFGESGNSNELPFAAGAVPSGPSSLTILAQ